MRREYQLRGVFFYLSDLSAERNVLFFLRSRELSALNRTDLRRVQPTVTFPIGDHVNVLHDYKKTGPSKILKLLSCRCHHLIDMLVEFCQNHIFLTLLKRLNGYGTYPSIFTNFCINYYAHMPCGETIAKHPSAYLNPLRILRFRWLRGRQKEYVSWNPDSSIGLNNSSS